MTKTKTIDWIELMSAGIAEKVRRCQMYKMNTH